MNIEQIKESLKIPFTQKEYFVTERGEILSNARGSLLVLKGKILSKKNLRLAFDPSITDTDTVKKVLIHRVVFFCYEYPSIIGKNLEDMTWNDFVAMPKIVHKNGNITDNQRSNLHLIKDNSLVVLWYNKHLRQKAHHHAKKVVLKK